MQSKSLFNNSSINGLNTTLLKSGLCKYFRRSETEKFEFCLIEMLYHQFNTNSETNSSKGAIITNLINRLKILIMEDLSPNEINIAYHGISLLNKFNKEEDLYVKMNIILNFNHLIISSKKCRVVSWINCFYKNYFIEDNDNDFDPETMKQFSCKNDTFSMIRLGSLLIKYLNTNDERIFHIFNKLCLISEKTGPRYRRTDASYLYFTILERHISSKYNGFLLDNNN